MWYGGLVIKSICYGHGLLINLEWYGNEFGWYINEFTHVQISSDCVLVSM